MANNAGWMTVTVAARDCSGGVVSSSEAGTKPQRGAEPDRMLPGPSGRLVLPPRGCAPCLPTANLGRKDKDNLALAARSGQWRRTVEYR